MTSLSQFETQSLSKACSGTPRIKLEVKTSTKDYLSKNRATKKFPAGPCDFNR